MTIPSLPTLDRTSPTFRSDLDTFFLSQLPATTAAFNDEIERINSVGYGSYNANSTTSLTIGLGSKSLTVEAAKGYVAGQAVLIASAATPSSYMAGTVTSYDSTTGALVVNVTDSNGSVTAADWVLSLTATGYRAPTVNQRTITGADTLTTSDQCNLINASGTFTLALSAAATLGSGWYCWLRNTSNGDVTVDPASAELIDGSSTYVLKPGFTVLLTCTGAAFGVMTLKQRTYNNISSHTATGSFVVPADTYVVRGYAVGKGGDGGTGAGTPGGGGGGMAYGDISVTPGETVSISISSGVATVTTAATVRLTGNPASGSTPGTASKHASVTNGGAYSGGPGGTGASFNGGGSAGSPLGGGYRGGNTTGTYAYGGGGGIGGIGGNATGGGGYTASGGGGGAGGQGAGGTGLNPGGGGGAGGYAAGASGGPARAIAQAFTDPLLRHAMAPGATGVNGSSSRGASASAGGGGSGAEFGGGNGGDFGGGGGGTGDSGWARGGLLGGGGGGAGNGGYGGGGGTNGTGTPGGYGLGGAACVLIFY